LFWDYLGVQCHHRGPHKTETGGAGDVLETQVSVMCFEDGREGQEPKNVGGPGS
jgi:hypothetical protein